MNKVKTSQDREVSHRKIMSKEAIMKQALNTATGLKKIASALSNPVRKKLDYIGISRKFVISELWPDGMPMIFDRDVEEFILPAVIIGKNGSARYTEVEVERITVEPFEILINPRIPYRELYSRLYQVVKRVKERIEQSMALREDLIFYGALDTASAGFHPTISVATYLTKDALARSMTPIEAQRLVPQNILMTAYGIQGIRRWQYQDIDDVARQEIRTSGYLGSIWGTQMYITDQLSAGTYYVMASPEFLAWMPMRKEVEVVPADVPEQAVLGFVAYEYYGLVIHNCLAVLKGQFNSLA